MAQTPLGLTYPEAGDHTRLWEHFQALAESVEAMNIGGGAVGGDIASGKSGESSTDYVTPTGSTPVPITVSRPTVALLVVQGGIRLDTGGDHLVTTYMPTATPIYDGAVRMNVAAGTHIPFHVLSVALLPAGDHELDVAFRSLNSTRTATFWSCSGVIVPLVGSA